MNRILFIFTPEYGYVDITFGVFFDVGYQRVGTFDSTIYLVVHRFVVKQQTESAIG